MINSKFLLNDIESCIQKLGRKGISKEEVLKAQNLIIEKNKLIQKVEKLRSQKNEKSQEIAQWVQKKETDKINQVKEELSEFKKHLQEEEDKLESIKEDTTKALLNLPNFPHNSAPDGKSSKDNIEISRDHFNESFFNSKEFPPHWEIMEELGIFDQDRASKITGSMFAILKGSGAKLLRSLISFGLDIFQDEFTELIVPSLVNTESLTGTGHLPKFAEDAYHIEKDGLWAIPTAEVPLTALHRKEILDEKTLPLKYMSYTPCFRREAGSAGQENRGLQRLHEFHKLELVKLCKPSEGEKELESLLRSALKPIQLLKLPYRVLDLCTKDLTFSSARTYDIEVYSPATKSWLEASSVSLFTDYQCRRSQIRYKEGKKIEYLHSLNGSGLATPRVLACLLENYWEKKGKVKVPTALIPYMKQEYL